MNHSPLSPLNSQASAGSDVLRDPLAGALKARASTDPRAAIKQAAKQFEALFMQQVMKSMRDTTLSTGTLDNAGTKMGTDMLDTEFANKMTGMPGGLGQAIERQLLRQLQGGTAGAAGSGSSTNDSLSTSGLSTDTTAAAAPLPGSAAGAPVGRLHPIHQAQASFVAAHTAAAQAAQAKSGIPATFMVAQAAHETGWGRHVVRNADGSSAHNLFGVKADASWTGPVAVATTTEVINGQIHKVSARFRAYASDTEAFQDYANMMKNSPRYANVVANAGSAQGFAQGLQRAGYATDPAYAAKLTQLINTTLRVQRGSV